MTTQKEKTKITGETTTGTTGKAPQTTPNKNQRPANDEEETLDTDLEDTTSTVEDEEETETGRRDERTNDPTRIRPGVNDPQKVDPTRLPNSQKKK